MSFQMPILQPAEPGPVPRILHQVWVGGEVPEWVQRLWIDWRSMTEPRGWQVFHWTDGNREHWPLTSRLASEFPDLPPVVLADLIRVEQVWKHGGVYMDSDMLPLRPIDELADRGSWIQPAGWYDPHGVGRTVEAKTVVNNGAFGFSPKHPFVAEVLMQAVRKIQTGVRSPLYIAGPNVFQRVLNSAAAADTEQLAHGLIPDLERKVFDSIPSEDVLEKRYPKALAVHLGNRSWYGANHSWTDTKTLIMAVPWEQDRKERAEDLAEQVRGKIVWDRTRNAFDTWRSVLREAGDDPVVILEDDVAIVPDWRSRVESAIAEHSDVIIQFFSLRSETESHWEPGRTFLMNQCYYLPRGTAAALLEFSEDWVEKNPEYRTGYDVCMAAWMRREGLRYWMHHPSLVQHEPWKSEINPKRPRNRQSKSFVGV